MRTHRPPHQPSQLARRTGLAYLGIIATGIFAEFVVRGSLVVDDDAIATADQIAASPALFGIGIGADIVMIGLDVAVAVGLFRLLRHVDRHLALSAMVLRLIQGVVIAVNLVNLAVALGFARDAVGVDGTVLLGPAQDALDAVERHALGYDIGLIAFGLNCLVLGRLLLTSRAVPRTLAVGMSWAGAVYLVGSFAALFAPNASGLIDPLYVLPFAVELAFAIRLVTRGLETPAEPTDRDRRPTPTAAGAERRIVSRSAARTGG